MITPVQIVKYVVLHINFGAVCWFNEGQVGLVIVITVLL